MSRKKRNQSFASLQREIARRLHSKLPLAGMIAATSLFCGCDELPTGRTSGLAPREEAPQCERKSPTPATQRNGQSEAYPNRTMGVPIPPKSEPNRQNETEEEVTSGDVPETPPPNEKNETKCPPTPGRTAKTTGK